MNDHGERSHLTMFGTFRVNRDHVMDLETWFKIHANVSKPKPEVRSLSIKMKYSVTDNFARHLGLNLRMIIERRKEEEFYFDAF